MADDRKKFEEWMRKVDAHVERKVGLSTMDLPDCPFWDWWADGMTPSEAASRTIKSAMGYMAW